MSIYRQHEDPWKLEDQLKEAKAKLEEAREKLRHDPDNEKLWDEVEHYALEAHGLKERVNFAWQDQEYDSDQQ